ncbi:phosphorylated adapter RNA export protein [Folsomia candida]|nr:phosphorylated adapter RNA export protein [Folsomia candida]
MLDDDLEEGEISSDGDKDELSVDYEVLQRPVKGAESILGTQVVHNKLPAGSSRTMGIDPVYQSVSRPIRPAPVLQKLPDDDDDGLYDDKSSSSSEDSDDEYGPSGRKCRRMPMPVGGGSSSRIITDPNNVASSSANSLPLLAGNISCDTPMDIPSSNDAFKNHAATFQQKRKPNNIWSSVLQEEEATDILGKVNVEEYDDQHVLIDRGPETFSVKYKNRPPVRQRSDSSSVSSGGLTDDELEYLRGTSFKEQKESVVMDEGVEDDGEGFVEQFGRRPVKRRYNTKLRRQRKKRKNKLVNKMKKMGPAELGYYIAKKLDEAKHNLIINSIELIGKEAVIALFLKTTKIERLGGLMVMNQQRRRTAGGVFFYLLRGDPKFPKKIVDKIFAVDVQNQRVGKKRAHKEKRLKTMEKLEEKLVEEHQKLIEQGVKESTHQNLVDVNESSLSEGEDDDVDSDEFFATDQAPTYPPSAADMRSTIGYDDQDCLDIHCDSSDLM